MPLCISEIRASKQGGTFNSVSQPMSLYIDIPYMQTCMCNILQFMHMMIYVAVIIAKGQMSFPPVKKTALLSLQVTNAELGVNADVFPTLQEVNFNI